MTINTKELRAFLSISGYMKPDNQLPAYEYTQWRGNTLTRCNEGAFCQSTVSSPAKTPVLLETALIQKYAADTISETIEITIKGLKVTLSDGKTPITFVTIEADTFPTVPKHAGDWVDFTPALSSVKVARSFMEPPVPLNSNFGFVHVQSMVTAGEVGVDGAGITYILATDNSTIYGCEIEQIGINALISHEACQLLSGLERCEYSTSERHDYYRADTVIFGFTKTECKTPAILPYVKQWRKVEGISYEINRNELLSFCDLASFLKKGGIPAASINSGALHMPEDEYGRGANSTLKGSEGLEFTFQAAIMGKMIKALPAQLLRVRKDGDILLIENSVMTPCNWIAAVRRYLVQQAR